MPRPTKRLNASETRRFSELRQELEVWGTHEITQEPVLIKYVNFTLSKNPSWILIDFTESAEKNHIYLGSNAVEALSKLERMRGPSNCSLPLNMQIRFLEIIYSDIDQLLAHKDDNVFVACNLRTLRGLISTLALAYVDQDCPDFMTILTASEQVLAVTADPQADKIGPLLELKDIISARLLEISPNFVWDYHAKTNQTN